MTTPQPEAKLSEEGRDMAARQSVERGCADAQERQTEAILRDPDALHVNMLRGGIAKLNPAHIGHLYRGDEARAVIAEVIRQNPEAAPSPEWRPIESAPRDGTLFYVHLRVPYRFKLYKPTSNEAKAGKAGRWQAMNEWGGWENAADPGELATWEPHPSSATGSEPASPGTNPNPSLTQTPVGE